MTKITKTDRFNQLREFVSTAYQNEDKAEVLAFINNELELLAKKANRSAVTPTKTQTENISIKSQIVAFLSTQQAGVTITQMMAECAELAVYSNQKLSALTKQLVDEGTVTKTVEKKKSYFSLTEVAEDVNEEEDVNEGEE